MENKNYTIHKSGNLRGEKILYKDGVGCCIWIPFKKDSDTIEEEPGLCFDFSGEDLPALRDLAHSLMEAVADEYIEDPEQVKLEQEWKAKENKWWYKVKEWLGDIHIGISPFEWRFTTFMVTRPVNHKRMLMFQWCKGFIFGPLRVCWH